MTAQGVFYLMSYIGVILLVAHLRRWTDTED